MRNPLLQQDRKKDPLFFRTKTIVSVLMVVFLLELAVAVLPFFLSTPSFLGAVLPAVLSNLTNQKRIDNQLPVLAINPLLNTAASLKAHDMAEKGYFAHTSPEGINPWYWFSVAGYQYTAAGENLAINFKNSADITDAWMHSPTHRANIEKNAYTEMGTGVATGTYQGRKTVFVAQVFAKPATSSVAMAVVLSPTSPTSYISRFFNNSAPVPMAGATALLPLRIANGILLVLLTVSVLAFFFALFVQRGNMRWMTILKGAVLISVVLLAYWYNRYLLTENEVDQASFVSFHGEVFDQN